MNVLFIGNSYTYFNDMPKIFEKLANSNGKDVAAFSVTRGGRKLCEYAQKNDEYTAKLDGLIKNNKYDICFIQEQSLLPIKDYELFETGVRDIHERVGEKADRFVLYETWGRKEGNKDLAALGITNREMTKRLSEAYARAAKVINAEVSHVGKAFCEVYSAHKEIELYNEDMTHPSYKGSCLSALTHYVTVFGELPGNTDCLELSEDEKAIFKRAVMFKTEMQL